MLNVCVNKQKINTNKSKINSQNDETCQNKHTNIKYIALLSYMYHTPTLTLQIKMFKTKYYHLCSSGNHLLGQRSHYATSLKLRMLL